MKDNCIPENCETDSDDPGGTAALLDELDTDNWEDIVNKIEEIKSEASLS